MFNNLMLNYDILPGVNDDQHIHYYGLLVGPASPLVRSVKNT